ncbi:class I adenylate-forming enzyme family protein [Antrihabitans cavernicola]|uniref:Long-chain fatty acid--CoA ligase n=1 Tax=Antrihabitans cavernicola TaxID=2495913 RepID=A0A5A7S9E5_9NOCA|nr:long-chain fatty acid--CoA ligase [Spelaeibacter cavernicola]KAA0022526.1 long-chain fatty acid--CoA ligase [Spelaeibacter cavernicola]
MSASLVEYPTTVPVWADSRVARCSDGLLRYCGLTPSLTEFLDVRAHRYANRDAVTELGGAGLTYRELWTSASRIAGGLQTHGISVGDRVAIRFPNGVRWVQAFLGVLLSGAVPVPVDDALADTDAAHVLADSEADYILDDTLPIGLPFIDDGACLSELALLCYTRGTTGRPKGVELSNENLLSAIESVIRAEGLTGEGIRNLVLLPLAHASGCVDQLLPTLAVGGTLVLAPDLPVDGVARVVESAGIDVVTATSGDYRAALAGGAFMGVHADRLRTICCAGDALADADTAVLRSAFPSARHWSWWGATETSGIGLTMPDDCAAMHPGRVGIAFGGAELALWGDDAHLGTGELLCRGPHVMRGYWKNPTATAAQFTGNWFHTGDLVDIDREGYVRLIGRVRRSAEQPSTQSAQGV